MANDKPSSLGIISINRTLTTNIQKVLKNKVNKKNRKANRWCVWRNFVMY